MDFITSFYKINPNDDVIPQFLSISSPKFPSSPLQQAIILDKISEIRKISTLTKPNQWKPINAILETSTWMGGNELSIADIYLFYTVYDKWSKWSDFEKVNVVPSLTRWCMWMERWFKKDGFDYVKFDYEKVEATMSLSKESKEKVPKDKSPKEKVPKQETTTIPATDSQTIHPSKIDLRVGLITSIKKHENADSLYVEQILLGDAQPRTICSGLVKWLPEESLLNEKVVCVCNLKPVKMRGVESQGMVLASTSIDETYLELIKPPKNSQPGDKVYVKGYENGDPEPVLNPKKKQWETFQPGLKIDQDGVVVWNLNGNGGPLITKNGESCYIEAKDKLIGASIK